MMKRALALLAIGLTTTTVLACSSASNDAQSPNPTATASATAEPTSASTAEPSSKPADLFGTWTSPSCGARTYERIITLGSSNAFEAQDRVSPCPPNVHCVWSGIVGRRGTFEVDGDKVKLTTTHADSKAGEPLPEELTFANGKLTETASGNPPATCEYTKQ